MACATLFHSHTGKRRIDSVDGVDTTGAPSKCKRSSNLDFGLSSASFGSPPRLGRSSPPYRDAGRLSPKYFAKPSGSSSPSLNHATASTLSSSTSSTLRTHENPSWSTTSHPRSDSTCSKPPADREPRITIHQVVELCKQELRQLDLRLRHEYEQALSDKLSEQYQAFLQFAQDELQTSMGGGVPPDAEMSYIG